MKFTRGLGYLADDRRPGDVPYEARLSASQVPAEFDLLAQYPAAWRDRVEDQGYTNSCVGQASGTFAEFVHQIATGRFVEFSHSFCYWNARAVRSWTNVDQGSFIRDSFEQLGTTGICLESFHPMWPKKGPIAANSSVFRRPDQAAYSQAKRHRLINPRRLDRRQIFDAIASHRPVVFGFTVYSHVVFGPEARQTGIIRMPTKLTDWGGGHAVVIAGYSEPRGKIWGPNSWGSQTWGVSNSRRTGWYEMDMDYVFNSEMSADFWTADYLEETTV